MAAQHIENQIGRKRHLPAGLFMPRHVFLNQAGNHRAIAKRALHQSRFIEPSLQIIAQHILRKQRLQRQLFLRDHQPDIAQAPYGQPVIIGDKTHWPRAHALHAPRQQHAQCLMRQAPLKRIGCHIIARAAGKTFDQQRVFFGQGRKFLLHGQPLRHLRRQITPAFRVRQHGAHAFGQMGGDGKFAALIGRHFRVGMISARHQRLGIAHRFQPQGFTGKNKCVAGRERGQKIFFHLAQNTPAA